MAKVPRWTVCDLLAPPEVLKKYVTKNKEEPNAENMSDWTPYIFDFNKIEKSPKPTKRTANDCWNIRHWGTRQNAEKSGYIPGSDSVSFWCNSKCPDLAIKKIFAENPGVLIRFYWFNENDEKEHYYIRMKNGKTKIKNGEGVLK